MSVHNLIDEFVSTIDPSGNAFRRIDGAPLIETLELKLQRRFPASFRYLIMRYAFSPFDAGGIAFFANTGFNSPDDLSIAIFNDRKIADATLEAGYIQFGRPENGSYDPICFYAGRSVSNREFPIVRLDHEEILCNDRIRVAQTVADSFYQLALSIAHRA